MSSAARQTRRVHLDGCDQAAVGLGFAAFGAELLELEARCHEHLECAQPTVLAGPRTRRGRRLIIYYHGPADYGFMDVTIGDKLANEYVTPAVPHCVEVGLGKASAP